MAEMGNLKDRLAELDTVSQRSTKHCPRILESVVRTSPIRVSVLMEALLVLLLSYETHPISIYLLVGQQDLHSGAGLPVAC